MRVACFNLILSRSSVGISCEAERSFRKETERHTASAAAVLPLSRASPRLGKSKKNARNGTGTLSGMLLSGIE
jgi:hypothetical protein